MRFFDEKMMEFCSILYHPIVSVLLATNRTRDPHVSKAAGQAQDDKPSKIVGARTPALRGAYDACRHTRSFFYAD